MGGREGIYTRVYTYQGGYSRVYYPPRVGIAGYTSLPGWVRRGTYTRVVVPTYTQGGIYTRLFLLFRGFTGFSPLFLLLFSGFYRGFHLFSSQKQA